MLYTNFGSTDSTSCSNKKDQYCFSIKCVIISRRKTSNRNIFFAETVVFHALWFKFHWTILVPYSVYVEHFMVKHGPTSGPTKCHAKNKPTNNQTVAHKVLQSTSHTRIERVSPTITNVTKLIVCIEPNSEKSDSTSLTQVFHV